MTRRERERETKKNRDREKQMENNVQVLFCLCFFTSFSKIHLCFFFSKCTSPFNKPRLPSIFVLFEHTFLKHPFSNTKLPSFSAENVVFLCYMLLFCFGWVFLVLSVFCETLLLFQLEVCNQTVYFYNSVFKVVQSCCSFWSRILALLKCVLKRNKNCHAVADQASKPIKHSDQSTW